MSKAGGGQAHDEAYRDHASRTIKRISGQKTLQMVERYAHANGEHIAAAMDKLEQRYKEAS